MRNWLNTKLVPQWRIWWKLHSIQLGIIVSAAFSAFLADPAQLVVWIHQLPPAVQASLPYWFGPFVAVLIFLARFWDQHKSLLNPASLAADPVGTAADVIAGVKGLEAAAKSNPLIVSSVTMPGGTVPLAAPPVVDPAIEASKPLPGQGE